MLRCMLCRKRLGAYLDGELSRRKGAAFEKHLKKCPSCRAALEEVRGLDQVLRSVDVPPPPSDMVLRIMSEARDLKASRAQRETGDSRRGLFLQPAWAFRAATVAVVILGVSAGSFMGWNTGDKDAVRQDRGTGMYEGYLLESFSATPVGSLEAGTLALLGEERR